MTPTIRYFPAARLWYCDSGDPNKRGWGDSPSDAFDCWLTANLIERQPSGAGFVQLVRDAPGQWREVPIDLQGSAPESRP